MTSVNIESNKTFNINIGSFFKKQDKTIDIHISEHAQEHFKKPLAYSNNIEISYYEMLQSANNLAYKLFSEHFISNNEFVALLIEKDVNIFSAYLGILKSGAAFVPMLPDHPLDRLKFILTDSDAKVIVTQKRFSALIKQFEVNIPVIYLEDIPTTICDFKSRATLDSLAYMIYTSGSTGNPKGVLISNQALVDSIISHNLELKSSENDKYLLLNALCFDASVIIIFSALLSGSSIYCTKSKDLDALEIAHEIKDEEITQFLTFPSFLNQLINIWNENKDLLDISRQLKIECGGEAMSVTLAEYFYTLNSKQINLFNIYGPTETAIASHIHLITKKDLSRLKTIPIGHLLPGRNCKIMDINKKEVKSGCSGELWLGGIGLGDGYNNLKEETEENFITYENKPFYRTGDLVQINSDQTLTYLDRIDNQINIRGNRVELSEIDMTFVQNPNIDEALSVLVNKNSENEMIVIYYTARSEQLLTREECSDYLKQSLPEYMIPNLFIKLAKFPINSSDKIDRKYLIKIAEEQTQRTNFEEPSDEIEKLLKYFWSNALGFENFGVEDIFFELGGHSLLATKIISLINKAFKIKIPIFEFFENPVISDFREIIIDYVDDEDKALKIAKIRINQLKI